jgi:transporter family protein
MSELNLVLFAASIAAGMALLVRRGVSSSMRAAVRTTIVLLLAWALAYRANGPISWPDLSWRMWLMLALSVFAVALAWTLHFLELNAGSPAPVARADKINIFIAAAFALLLILGSSPQRYAFALSLISGATILAFRRS